MIPSYYRFPSFSVAEMVSITEIPEDTFRTWIARNVTEFTGRKEGHRLWFTGVEAFFFSLVRDLVNYGVGVRIAMYIAAQHTRSAEVSPPLKDECLVVQVEGSKATFLSMSRCEISDVARASVYIPLYDLWQRIMTRSAEAFVKEAN